MFTKTMNYLWFLSTIQFYYHIFYFKVELRNISIENLVWKILSIWNNWKTIKMIMMKSKKSIQMKTNKKINNRIITDINIIKMMIKTTMTTMKTIRKVMTMMTKYNKMTKITGINIMISNLWIKVQVKTKTKMIQI